MPGNEFDTTTESEQSPRVSVLPFGLSRRRFIGYTGTAVAVSAGAAVVVTRLGTDATGSDADPGVIPVALRVNGTEHTLDLDPGPHCSMRSVIRSG